MIYIVIKLAKEMTGEFVMASTEKAFRDRNMAEAYVKSMPVVWEEQIGGSSAYCERGIHEVELVE